jgi:Mn2+/Fe2+ NRAMP family transporter
MWLYTGLIGLGGAAILIPGIPLIPLMLLSQVLNGILLPFVLVFILILINCRRLMGPYLNRPFTTAWPGRPSACRRPSRSS